MYPSTQTACPLIHWALFLGSCGPIYAAIPLTRLGTTLGMNGVQVGAIFHVEKPMCLALRASYLAAMIVIILFDVEVSSKSRLFFHVSTDCCITYHLQIRSLKKKTTNR